MEQQKKEKIQETAKQVAEVLAKNGATYYEGPRIFAAAEHYLTVKIDPQEN